METIPVGLVGVTGYTGMELARILATHPVFRLVRATSRTEGGKPLSALYPFLSGFPAGDVTVTAPDAADLAKACRVVFLAVPHGTAMDYAAELLAAGATVIDLSADFRLADPAVYAAWYGQPHRHPELLPQAVYGLPELYADAIQKARLVANPGCYPTSVILGLAPALVTSIVETDDIVADSKSGATGAGRKAAAPNLFCEVHDSFRAYSLGKHRHTPEIEQEIGKLAGADMTISFNPHLLPIDRGILSTIYTKLSLPLALHQVRDIYALYVKDKPWMRLLPEGALPETRFVRGSMFCDIGLVVDERTNRLIIVTAIDNLCRGASGQAVANANLVSGLPVDTGLHFAPMMP